MRNIDKEHIKLVITKVKKAPDFIHLQILKSSYDEIMENLYKTIEEIPDTKYNWTENFYPIRKALDNAMEAQNIKNIKSLLMGNLAAASKFLFTKKNYPNYSLLRNKNELGYRLEIIEKVKEKNDIRLYMQNAKMVMDRISEINRHFHLVNPPKQYEEKYQKSRKLLNGCWSDLNRNLNKFATAKRPSSGTSIHYNDTLSDAEMYIKECLNMLEGNAPHYF
jgi:hypothetical protein